MVDQKLGSAVVGFVLGSAGSLGCWVFAWSLGLYRVVGSPGAIVVD